MRFAALVLVLPVMACSPVPQTSSSQPSATVSPYTIDDAYQIYSALFPHEDSYVIAQGSIAIREETLSGQELSQGCLGPGTAYRFRQAIADYKRVNQQPWLLQHKFHLSKPYEMVSAGAESALFGRDLREGWKAFYASYPSSGGLIEATAPGFNQQKTLAMVYTGSGCGPLCGRWSFHLLEKIKDEWQETAGVSCHTIS